MTGFYSSAMWRKLRSECIRRHPVCATAGCGGFSVVADHITPRSRGGTDTSDNLTGRCLTCHNARRGTAEPRLRGCDPAGTPRDAAHWWATPTQRPAFTPTDDAKPTGLAPSAVPLTIVCGPAGGGKTTLVNDRARPGDVVIDLDAIMAKVSGQPWYAAGKEWLDGALSERNRMLHRLATADSAPGAWFIVSAPKASDRAFWTRTLRPVSTVLMLTPLAECRRRIMADSRRAHAQQQHIAVARRWWDAYTVGWADETLAV